MIKNTELRIGNFVYPNDENGTYYPVTEIRDRSICCTDKGDGEYDWCIPEVVIGLCDIEPIPLTEEWLLKFGAIKCDSPEEQGYFLGKYRVFANSLSQINFCFFDFGDWYQHIEFVHQLQNLYFALTGVDLQLSST
jgi:hypothetical protein